MDVPETRYAATDDGVHIAYQVVGDGPLDLVWIHDWISNVELQWEEPLQARFLERLASFSRLLLFDKRGSGLSDRTVGPDLFAFEVRMDDVRAVLDEVGSEQAVLFGHADDGASLAAFFGAAYPERTRGLILYGARAKMLKDDDYPWGYEPTDADVWASDRESFWGTDAYARRWLRALAPSVANDDAVLRRYSRLLRQSASPGTEELFERVTGMFDIREMLPTIHVPTLVLHRSGDRDIPVEAGRDLAARIPGSRFVEVPGADGYPWAGDQEPILQHVEAFVASSSPPPPDHRVFATIVFTDIVGSTDRAAALGDSAWHRPLDRHDAVVREDVERHRGREVHSSGDGFLLTFDGPARAVKCAGAIGRGLLSLGLEIRAGVHAGEVELAGDDVHGMAVHIGSRVAALARASEVLVSSTVKDLVVGSGLTFEDAGEHELKGVPDRWRLYRVVDR